MNDNTVGVKNFRIFKDFTQFEIRPITLLTGPNNSGKSSLTKLLLLLQNGIENLDFESGLHNLEGFDQILNWYSKEEELTLEFENTISFLSTRYKIQFGYKKGQISRIQILSPEESLLKVEFTEDHLIEYGSVGFLQKVDFNVQHLINLIYEKDLLMKTSNRKSSEQSIYLTETFRPLKNIPVDGDNQNLTLEDHDLDFWAQEEFHEIRNQVMINKINNLENDYLLYDIFFKDSKPNPSQQEEILNLQNEIFSNLTFSINIGMSLGFKNFKQNFDHLMDEMNDKAQNLLQKRIKDYFGEEQISIKETALGRLIFKEKLFFDNFENFSSNPWEVRPPEKLKYLNTFIDEFKTMGSELGDYLGKFHYISPQRGNQKRVLLNRSENEIDEIVLQYSKLFKQQQNLPFLHEVLEMLEIEGKLKVKRYENFISVISLAQEQRNITLADLGYGYSQIIPVILKIILMMASPNQNQTLIIEEPEANLHPNLQSKLADLLVLSLKHYPELNFIVETHSEYLIRKLQFLTAKKEVSPKHSVIYYFNSDKFVSREEPKVKKIEVTSNGNLTDTFGPGFYDEAVRLQFNLMKINTEQKN